MFGDPTIGDAILDRVVHRAHRIELKGPSLRKRQALSPTAAETECLSGTKLSRESRLANWPCAARGGCESLLSAELLEALDVDDREPSQV